MKMSRRVLELLSIVEQLKEKLPSWRWNRESKYLDTDKGASISRSTHTDRTESYSELRTMAEIVLAGSKE